MGKRSRKRRARRAWVITWLLPWVEVLTERVQKARPRAAWRLGITLGTILRWLGVTRSTVRRNLLFACGRDLSRAELRRFERRYFEHLGLMIVEFLRLPTITARHVEGFGPGLTRVRELYDQGEGTIFVAGHAGLWELAGHTAGLAGLEILSVAKMSGHPGVDAWTGKLRESGGQRVRDVNGSMWAMKKALDRGEAVGINVDQEARKGRVFAPFFGILASTSNAPALLHLKTGAPIVVATVHRLGPFFRYELGVHDVIRHEPTGDREADVLAITTRINAAMESMIRRHPEQWLWSHRRWRRRPPEEPSERAFARAVDAQTLEVA